MAGYGIREDIVQLVVAAYDAAPDAALMRELEAIIDEWEGSLLDVAAALTSGDRWDDRYPASWTAGRFADEWLGSLLPGADAALTAAAREAVVDHVDAGGGFAELVLAAQQYLSGADVPARFAGAARAFLDRSEAAMARLANWERDGSFAGQREAPTLTAGVGGVVGDYDGDGVADDSKTETFDAAGRPVRIEYDIDSDGTVNHVETNTYNGDIITRLVESDYGKNSEADGGGYDFKAAGDGVFDFRWQGTKVGNAVIRTLFDADNDGMWDEPARSAAFYGIVFDDFSGWRTLTHTYGVDGWLESVKTGNGDDGVYDRIVTHSYSFYGDGGLKTWLSEDDDGWDGGTADRARDEVGAHREDGGLTTEPIEYGYVPGDRMIAGKRRLLTYGVDGVLESSKHDYDGDGAYDLISIDTYTYHANGRVKTRLTAFDGGPGRGPVDGVVDGRRLETYDAAGALESLKEDYDDDGDGVIESSKRDRDGDGMYEETSTYHDNGRIKTRLIEYGDGPDDPIALHSYDADGALRASREDLDGDGTYEQTYAYAYQENGKLETMLVEYDDGRGDGTAADGVVDWRSLIAYDANGAPDTVRLDNDGDGTWDFTRSFGRSAFVLSIGPTADRAINFTIGAAAGLDAAADDGATRHEPGPGDDTITGGAGKDVFVFRRGDGADVIMGFDPNIDTILIRGAGSADIELDALVLRAGEEARHPHIPAHLFPTDASAVEVAVLTYGGPDDRIIIVGGVGGNATGEFHSFPPRAGHEPDLSEAGG